MNCSPPSIRCSSSRRSSSASSLDRRVGRVARDLLDAEMPVGERRDLRQVGDRHHLRAPARRRSVSPTACAVWPPMPASISSKTIVSPPPTAAIASAIRESSPPEAVSATGANGQPAFGRIRNATSSAPAGRRLALAQLDAELALAQADALELLRQRPLRRAPLRSRRAARSSVGELVDPASRLGERFGRSGRGIVPPSSASSSALASRRAAKELLVALAAEPAPRLGDPVELGLDLLEPVGLGLERGEKGAELGGCLAQPQLDVAQLVPGTLELGGEPLERRDRPLGQSDEARRALALLRRQRLAGRSDALRELGHVAQALALVAQASPRCRARAPRCPRRAPAALLVAPAAAAAPWSAPRAGAVRRASSRQARRSAARRSSCSSPAKASSTSSWYGGPGEPALLELAGHRDQPLGRGRHVLPGGAPSPGVGARAAVGEDTAGKHEPFLFLRPQLGQRGSLLVVEEARRRLELDLDVGLVAVGPDERGVAARAEQEADRLREDRLAGAGLAGDRVQPGREGRARPRGSGRGSRCGGAEARLDATSAAPRAATGRTRRPRPVYLFTRAPGWEGVRDGTGLSRTRVCRDRADCVPFLWRRRCAGSG